MVAEGALVAGHLRLDPALFLPERKYTSTCAVQEYQLLEWWGVHGEKSNFYLLTVVQVRVLKTQ